MRSTIAMCLLFCFCGYADADIYQYAFSGLLPDGASSHSQISDGETFTLTFGIDSTSVDTVSSPDLGGYDDAVLFGVIEFAGGYSSPIPVDSLTVAIFNSNASDGVEIFGPSASFIVQAFSDDVGSLDSDALPSPGTTLASDFMGFNYTQLLYEDAFGDVFYNASTAQNVVFSASVIPEPGCVGLLTTSLLLLLLRKRRAQINL